MNQVKIFGKVKEIFKYRKGSVFGYLIRIAFVGFEHKFWLSLDNPLIDRLEEGHYYLFIGTLYKGKYGLSMDFTDATPISNDFLKKYF